MNDLEVLVDQTIDQGPVCEPTDETEVASELETEEEPQEEEPDGE